MIAHFVARYVGILSLQLWLYYWLLINLLVKSKSTTERDFKQHTLPTSLCRISIRSSCCFTKQLKQNPEPCPMIFPSKPFSGEGVSHCDVWLPEGMHLLLPIQPTWLTLCSFNITMENDHLWWNFPLNMMIFHSYMLSHRRVSPTNRTSDGSRKTGTLAPKNYDRV